MIRFLSFQPPAPPPKRYEIGPETNYPLGSRTVLADIPALLVREPEGFVAISMVCTHLGCTVERKPEGFVCQCHGSRYDEDGVVTKGPAVEPLPQLTVEKNEDGSLVILMTAPG